MPQTRLHGRPGTTHAMTFCSPRRQRRSAGQAITKARRPLALRKAHFVAVGDPASKGWWQGSANLVFGAIEAACAFAEPEFQLVFGTSQLCELRGGT